MIGAVAYLSVEGTHLSILRAACQHAGVRRTGWYTRHQVAVGWWADRTRESKKFAGSAWVEAARAWSPGVEATGA
jgi:hypothetical protein